MTGQRKVKMIISAQPTLEGAGVKLKRALGFSQDNIADPFLLLDHFHSNNPDDYKAGFPWHPHRGIETITYMLEGKVEHSDSMGNKGVIKPGEVQWMTAGSGIIHQEMPKPGHEGEMHGFQLWANLPAKNKMMDPRYREVKSRDIPVHRDKGAIIRVIAGRAGGAVGPVKDIVTDPEYFDITLEPKAEFSGKTVEGHTVMAFVMDGSADFESDKGGKTAGKLTAEEHLVIYSNGKNINILAGSQGARFLLISGKPINEPVAWYGPIVMNTQEELRVAFDEYENGNFLKHKV